jgi:putative flippase GtrA
MTLSKQLLRFSVIGAIGFAVDVGVLYLMRYLGLDLYSARVISFLAAASATWLGNRVFTFQSQPGGKKKLTGEWATYLLAMCLGGLANYVCYALLITYVPFFGQHIWLAVAGGTGAGLLINFFLARRILFKAPD